MRFIVPVIVCLLVAAYSGYSLYRTGFIYEDVKNKIDLWINIIMTWIANSLLGMYLLLYMLWKYFCEYVCNERVIMGFTCVKGVLFVGILGSFGWSIVNFIEYNKYRYYKDNYVLLWYTMHVQAVGVFLLILYVIVLSMLPLCKREKKGYNRI